MKECTKCKESKPLTDFYIRNTGKPHAQCKACTRAQVRARRHGPDREKVLEMDRNTLKERRAKVRDKVFAAYGGYECSCCGETEPLFLTLDHINNDGGEFRKKELGKRTMAGYHTYNWLLKNGCPPDVQVLCMNCQHGKLMNNGICPHKGRVTTS